MAQNARFIVDPCKACIGNKQYTMQNGQINILNQCYNETYTAFANVGGGYYSLPQDRFQDCKNCLEKVMPQMGTNPCNLRLYRVPTWIQTPHYFPHMLPQQGGNVESAYKQCIDMCSFRTNDRMTCEKYCLQDAKSVIGI